MSPSYQILSHFRHCWPNKKPCSQGATTTYLRRSEARRVPRAVGDNFRDELRSRIVMQAVRDGHAYGERLLLGGHLPRGDVVRPLIPAGACRHAPNHEEDQALACVPVVLGSARDLHGWWLGSVAAFELYPEVQAGRVPVLEDLDLVVDSIVSRDRSGNPTVG